MSWKKTKRFSSIYWYHTSELELFDNVWEEWTRFMMTLNKARITLLEKVESFSWDWGFANGKLLPKKSYEAIIAQEGYLSIN